MTESLATLLGDDVPAPEADSRLVKTGELAAIVGLTVRRVNILAKEGVIPRHSRGYFELAPAVRAYVDFLRKDGESEGTAATIQAEKLRLTREQADKVAITNAQARGELVSIEDVQREWVAVAVDLRAKVLAIPTRVQARAALDQHVTGLIDSEIRLALEGIADDG